MIAGAGAVRRLAEFHQQDHNAYPVERVVLAKLLAWSIATHGHTLSLQKECGLTQSFLKEGWTLPQLEQALDDLFRAGLIAVDPDSDQLTGI